MSRDAFGDTSGERPRSKPVESCAVCGCAVCGVAIYAASGLCLADFAAWCISPEYRLAYEVEKRLRQGFVDRVRAERVARAPTAESPAVQPARGEVES